MRESKYIIIISESESSIIPFKIRVFPAYESHSAVFAELGVTREKLHSAGFARKVAFDDPLTGTRRVQWVTGGCSHTLEARARSGDSDLLNTYLL